MRARIILIGLCLGLHLSCSDKDSFIEFEDDSSIQTLNGSWKVESFEDYQTASIEYQTQENSWGFDIVITFDDTKDPKAFWGQVTTNGVSGEFEYEDQRRFRTLRYGSTFVGQPEWGDKFVAAMTEGDVDFRINSRQLRIFYHDHTKGITMRKQ